MILASICRDFNDASVLLLRSWRYCMIQSSGCGGIHSPLAIVPQSAHRSRPRQQRTPPRA